MIIKVAILKDLSVSLYFLIDKYFCNDLITNLEKYNATTQKIISTIINFHIINNTIHS